MSPSVLALCVVLCLASYTTGSDIVLTSTPSTFKELITDELRLRCSLTDSASSVVIGKRDVSSDTAPTDVSFVNSITITKAGVDVALITEHLPARVFDNSTDVQVTGQIPGNGASKGFLEITWKNPGSAQAGSYKCDVRGMEQSGHIQDLNQTLDIAEDEVSFSDILDYTHQLKVKVNNLQTSNADLLKSNADLQKSNADIKTSNADLNAKVNNLQTSNADLQKSTAVLKTKVDTHVMFTATFGGNGVTLSAGQVLVFNNLVTSIGGGYSTSTGVFTAPVAGFYTFDVHVVGQVDKLVYVDLCRNNGWVTTAWADNGFDNQSASTSANLQLQKGDTVKVRSQSTSYVNDGGYTSFSGQLVSVA